MIGNNGSVVIYVWLKPCLCGHRRKKIMSFLDGQERERERKGRIVWHIFCFKVFGNLKTNLIIKLNVYRVYGKRILALLKKSSKLFETKVKSIRIMAEIPAVNEIMGHLHKLAVPKCGPLFDNFCISSIYT